jgi:acid phosphatase type 7
MGSRVLLCLCIVLLLSVVPSDGQAPPIASPSAVQPPTLFGVGDLMQCGSPAGADLTGRLMKRLLDETPNSRAITLGDNSNDDGSEEQYQCLDQSSWGQLMARVFPTPGNHDYGTDKVLPYYFLYFPNAGSPGRGYYAYNFGGWRIYALNSEFVEPADRREQLDWLERDLRANANNSCTMAYFHRPPFSSGSFGSPAWTMPIFRKLYKYGVDLVATGHEHFFATLPPLDPRGNVDTSYGVPILIAGTGGAVMFPKPQRLRYAAQGERVIAGRLGVLQMTLAPKGYEWAFLPVDASSPADSGRGTCHDNPPGYSD